MTLMEFFGSVFIGFGPPLVLFFLTVAKNPLMIIILMASAFFWLLSLLLTSILWFAVVPLREHLAFIILPSIFFQELMRILFFKLLNKAEDGLLKMASEAGQPNQGESVSSQVSKTSIVNPAMMAYVSGLGFGLMGGAMVLINLLNDMTGPGTIGLNGEPESFFLTINLQALAMILLNMFLSMIIFDAYQGMKKLPYIGAVVIHLFVAALTLLNSYLKKESYVAFIVVAVSFLAVIGCSIWAFFITKTNLKARRFQIGSSPDNVDPTPQPT